mmetsp:Transcript_52467/g.131971  ORF Transcript_52467/g.131971 Transcript_52467/m.131971 type:complete len:274 (+) Transcript_52467:71-892(+)
MYTRPRVGECAHAHSLWCAHSLGALRRFCARLLVGMFPVVFLDLRNCVVQNSQQPVQPSRKRPLRASDVCLQMVVVCDVPSLARGALVLHGREHGGRRGVLHPGVCGGKPVRPRGGRPCLCEVVGHVKGTHGLDLRQEVDLNRFNPQIGDGKTSDHRHRYDGSDGQARAPRVGCLPLKRNHEWLAPCHPHVFWDVFWDIEAHATHKVYGSKGSLCLRFHNVHQRPSDELVEVQRIQLPHKPFCDFRLAAVIHWRWLPKCAAKKRRLDGSLPLF